MSLWQQLPLFAAAVPLNGHVLTAGGVLPAPVSLAALGTVPPVFWRPYDAMIARLATGQFDLLAGDYRCTLCGGASNAGDLAGLTSYADLTDELPTANGYEAGGRPLFGPTLTNIAGNLNFDLSDPRFFAQGGPLTFRYLAIYDQALPALPMVMVAEPLPGGTVTVPDGNTCLLKGHAHGMVAITA